MSENITDFKVHNFKNNILEFRKLVDLYSKKNPALADSDDLKYDYAGDLYKASNDLLVKVSQSGSVRSDTYRVLAIRNLLSKPYLFNNIYKQIISEEKNGKLSLKDLPENVTFPANLEDAAKLELIYVISHNRDYKKEFLEGLFKSDFQKGLSYKKVEYYFDNILSPKDIKQMIDPSKKENRDAFNLIRSMQRSELERLKSTEKDTLPGLEKILSTDFKNAITILYDFFDRSGKLDDFIDQYNSVRNKELHVSKSYLNSYFSEENLQNLSFPNLACLYAFFSNRFSKIMENTRDGLFFELVSNGKDVNDMSESELSSLLLRKNYLQSATDKFLTSLQKKVDNNSLGPTSNDRTIFVKWPDSIKVASQYSEIFNVPIEDAKTELRFIKDSQNRIFNSYDLKNQAMLSALGFAFSDYSNIKNCGIAQEINDYDITDSLNKKNILVCFDVTGFNMPVRLHFPRRQLIQFVKDTTNSSFLSIYKGSVDFRQVLVPSKKGNYSYDKNLGTQILFKPTNEQISFLKDQDEKTNQKLDENKSLSSANKIYSHLYHISGSPDVDDIIPRFLEDKTIIKTKVKPDKSKRKKSNDHAPKYHQKIKYDFNREYISLDTGEVISEKEYKIRQSKSNNKDKSDIDRV